MSDLRLAVRQLLRNPGFAAVAVLTLALGIGANTALFSVVNGVLLKPLPYPEPDRLVTLWERSPQRGVDRERVSGPNYLDWQRENTTLDGMAVSPGWQGSEEFNLALPDGTLKVRGTYTSASLFTTLRTAPLLGRTFIPEEDNHEGNRVAILGHGLWRRQFGGDSNIIGRSLTIDTYGRRDYTIVGVMPPGFGSPGRSELWLPLGWMDVQLTDRRSAHWHNVIARLKPGVTLAEAQAELSAIQGRLHRSYPAETIGSEVAVVPLLDHALGRNVRTALMVLWGVVAGVLLIACANVANLMLARAAVRQREIAVRLALGAGRWRIMRQLLAENLLVAGIGGGLGLLLGGWVLPVVVTSAPGDIPRLADVTLDGRALLFTLGISLITGIVFGLAPAWHASRLHPDAALREGTRSASAGVAAGRTRNLLVIAEVAVSVVLLAGAAVMLRSFAAILRADRGFDPGHLLTVDLDFSVSGFTTWVRPTATRPQVPLRELIGRIREMPGVQAVGAGSRLLRRENNPPHDLFTVFGRPAVDPAAAPRAEFKGISPDWLRALGVRISRGRDFTEADSLEAPGVVLINETLARRYFPGEDPIGQRLKMGTSRPAADATNVWGLSEWSEIVGITSDVKSLHPQPEAAPEVYVPYWQYPMQSPTVLVRATGAQAPLAEAIRRETKAVIPNLPAPVIRTMDNRLAEVVARPRLQTGLLSLFAALALLLAAVGLYGVLACAVTQRHRELGIRIALGSTRRQIVALVVGQGLRLALVGAAAGLGCALLLTRALRSRLQEIAPADPWTFTLVPMLMIGVAIVACWVPARRAAKIDPIEALRCE